MLYSRDPFLITSSLGIELLGWLDSGVTPEKAEDKTKDSLIAEMSTLKTIKELVSWNDQNSAIIDSLSPEDKQVVIEYRATCKAKLIGGNKDGTTGTSQ
jgi:hypothetical protein